MAPYELPAAEVHYLRDLARRQAALTALPVMAERRQLWTDMNDAKPGARPPIVLESNTFDRDFLPTSLLQCATAYGRQLERQFLRALRHHEVLNDDHVCPDTLDMAWHVATDEFGIDIPTDRVKDQDGYETAYHFDCPIKDLARDGYAMVKPSTYTLDRDGTAAEKRFLENTFGDILPVVLRSGIYGATPLTQRLMRLMSMENFFIAMYDAPEQLHGLLAILRDNAIRKARWAEAEGILELNNGNQTTCGTCYNFTTLLPRQPLPNGRARLKDMWAAMDSQETVGVSPKLFNEFVFPYYKPVADLFGLVYWGCCEPVHPLWESSLKNLPNLKAISISRWADQKFMANALDGKGIVFSRKPDPNLLGVDVELDEAAWTAEIRSTLDAVRGKNVPVEFVVRDVYTLHGNLKKARRAVDLAREQIDRYYAPRPAACSAAN